MRFLRHVRPRPDDRAFCVALFVTAVSISLAATAKVTGFDAIEPGDEQEYFDLARALLEQHAFPSIFRTPAYPGALALVFAITGPSVAAGKIFNCLLGGFTPIGVFCLASLLLPRRHAMLAAAITTLQPTVFFLNATFYSETMSTVTFLWVNVAMVRIVSRTDADGGPRFATRDWLLLGALLALLVLVKPQHALWLPFLVLGAVWRFWRAPSRALAVVALAALGFCATLTPWWIRNALVTGEFVPFTTSGAKTFLDANNPTIAHMERKIVDIDGRSVWVGPGKFIHNLKDVEFVDLQKVDSMTEVQSSRYFSALVIDWIRNHPGDWLRLCLYKLGYAFSVWPIWQGGMAQTALGLSFLPILAFSIPGWLTLARRPGVHRILLTHVATFVLVTIIFFGSWRYRNPYEGSFTIAAVVGFAALFPRILRSEDA